MNTAERLLVGDVIHQDEAHGASVVGCRDGPVPLLARRVLKTGILKLFLVVTDDFFKVRRSRIRKGFEEKLCSKAHAC